MSDRAEHRVLILSYHHVGRPPPGFERRNLWVTPDLLALHVRLVRRLGYKLTTVSTALAAASGRFACVTFDDGFADVVRLGYPALDALRVPATLYVVTDEVGRRAVVFAEDDGTSPSDIASWDDLRTLATVGWEIGSHCSTHRRLARLRPEEQRMLLERSRDAIAHEIGLAPRALAYPYGSFSAATAAAARDLGFESAVTTRRGIALSGIDRLRLPRLTMGGHRALHAARVAKILLMHARAEVAPGGRVRARSP